MKNYPNAQEFKNTLNTELSKIDNSTKAINNAARLTRDKIDELTIDNQELKNKVSSLNTFSLISLITTSVLLVLIILAVKNVL